MSIRFSHPGEIQPTAEAVADPRPGDRFTEMYNFWLFVIGRDGNQVTTIEGTAPCELPGDGIVRVQSVEEFGARLSYRSGSGYWVRLVDRNYDVTGWLERAQPARATDGS